MKVEKLHQPHDKLIKSTLSDVRIAREFFSNYLPERILKDLDLSSLGLIKNSFVSEEFKASEADVVYHAKIKSNDIILYLLCEHTTKPDKWLPLRQMQYRLRILEYYRKQNPGKKLPFLYSLVLYTGKKPYHYSTNFFDLFQAEREIAEEFFRFPTKLIDVCRLKDEDIEKKKWFGLVEFAFKYNEQVYFEQLIQKVSLALTRIDTAENDVFINSIMLYLINTFDLDIESFQKTIENELSKQMGGKTMSIAERFRQLGIEEGMKQGIGKGIEQGRRLGLADGIQKGIQSGMQSGIQSGMKIVAERLIAEGFPAEKVALLTDLSPQQVEALLPAVIEQSR